MIYVLLGFLVFMRVVPEYIDSDTLYWWLNCIISIIISIYVFRKSSKNVFSLLALFFFVGFFAYEFVEYCSVILYPFYCDPEHIKIENAYIIFLPNYLKTLGAFTIYLLIFRNRYQWRKQKSVAYNPNRVQAIYSKPKSVLTLLGATTSLSPKCSVRFSFNGETIRFKKGNKNPIKEPTILKGDEIIEETIFSPDDFIKRYEEIKDEEYNLFTFNCRSLMRS